MNLIRLVTGICLLFPHAQGELISMTVCSDDICSKDCVSWTATSGKCAPCQSKLGDCSAKNPSSIVTTSYITLYSDSTCQKVISGTENMGLLMDSGCNILVAAGSNHIGSYKASNTSAIVGGVVAGSFLLICLCICGCCMRRGCKSAQKQNNINPPPSTYIAPLVPYPTNLSYNSPQVIQHHQYYPPQQQSQEQSQEQSQSQFYQTYVPHYPNMANVAPPYYGNQQSYTVMPPPPSAPPAYYPDYPSK